MITARCTLVKSAVLRLHVVRQLRLSVTLSVCLWRWWIRNQDHISWKSWKLIARQLASHLRYVAQRPSTYSQGNMGKFWGGRWDGEKRRAAAQKAAISLKRVKIDEKLIWLYYSLWELTNTLSNGTISDPHGLPFPKIGGSQPQLKTAVAIISKATDCKFGRYLHMVHPNKAHEKFERKAWAFPKVTINN